MTQSKSTVVSLLALLGLAGCVVPPPGSPYATAPYPAPYGQPYAQPYGQPYPPPDELYYSGDQPMMVIGGETVFFLLGAEGWGYWDREHRWHHAPQHVSSHLESRYPRGNGFRPSPQASVGSVPAAARPGGGGWQGGGGGHPAPALAAPAAVTPGYQHQHQQPQAQPQQQPGQPQPGGYGRQHQPGGQPAYAAPASASPPPQRSFTPSAPPPQQQHAPASAPSGQAPAHQHRCPPDKPNC